MKNKKVKTIAVVLAVLLVSTTIIQAQTTAFTYQGRLYEGANPAGGIYDLRFTLYDSTNNPGTLIAGPLTNSATGVSNGLFTVTLDFGANFPGANRWLEIAVRTNGSGAFTALSPRQKMTPSPYAIYAGGASAAGLSGAIPTANLSGTYGSTVTFSNAANRFSGNGTGLTNVNAISLGGFGASSFWNIGGNAGTTPGTQFLGTTDNLPVEFKVNGTRALRLEPNPNAPNVIGGSAANEVTNGIYGAVIAGGGSSSYPNRVGAVFGTVVGGNGNTASGNFATAMGQFNTASGYAGTAMGYATAAGGFGSQAGGTTAKANHDGAFVWADNNFADFTSTAANQFLIRAAGGVGINTNNPNGAALAVQGNVTIEGSLSATGLSAGSLKTTVIDTPGNESLTLRANGQLGLRLDPGATSADLTAPGSLYFSGQTRQMLNLSDGSAGIGTQPGVLYFRSFGALFGPGNFSWYAGGTHSDTAFDPGSGFFFPGREQMRLDGTGQLTVYGSTANGVQGISTSAGASGVYGQNDGGGFGVAGRTGGGGSAVFGDNADASGWAGNFNGRVFVGGNQHFGNQTRQMLNLWGTQYGIGVQNNNLYFRTDNVLNGAFRWYKGGVHNDASANPGGGTTMMWLTDSGLSVNGTFVSSSDRNAKENFKPVDPRAVLDKVAALPLSEWNYKTDTASRHLGPMAQDFYAAFHVGPDDKHIAIVDESGVALAAIQGLNQKVEDLNGQLKRRDAENAELKRRLERLEKLIDSKNGPTFSRLSKP